jgi:predicted ArsR family transcriptional regulator
MDVPARPEDPLAHPTRARLFRLVADLRRPVATDELAERLDLHPNGVRAHLGRLLKDGLLERDRARGRRGRPRDMWTIAAGAHPGGRPPSSYVQLGCWLVRVLDGVGGSRITARRIEATGRRIGRELAPAGEGSVDERMRTALSSMGFQPRREDADGLGLAYRLENCPFCEAVHESPDVVCTLHRGITRGLLDAIAPEARLAAFVPGTDPLRAGCLIRLRGGPALRAMPNEPSPHTPAPTPPARPTPTRAQSS